MPFCLFKPGVSSLWTSDSLGRDHYHSIGGVRTVLLQSEVTFHDADRKNLVGSERGNLVALVPDPVDNVKQRNLSQIDSRAYADNGSRSLGCDYALAGAGDGPR